MMRAGIPLAFAAGAILGTATVPGHAATKGLPIAPTSVRSGDHPDFGRVVIDTDGHATYHLEHDGDHVVLHFAGDMKLGNPPAPPRNVIAITTDGATADLTLTHGARIHPMRIDGRVVLDVLDAAQDDAKPAVKSHRRETRAKRRPHAEPETVVSPEPDRATRPVAATAKLVPVQTQILPVPTPVAIPVSVPVLVAAPIPIPVPVSVPAAAATPAPAPAAAAASGQSGAPTVALTEETPPGRDVMPENEGPLRLRARRIRLPKEMDGTAFLVPFDSATGAAAFREGDVTYIVFDERRPVDLAGLQTDAVFRDASVQLLPTGTLFRVPLPATLWLALTQMPQGWRIAALTAPPKEQPIGVTVTDQRLNLTAEQSGDVVSLADPDTGATLLAGTQHRPGQGVATARRSSDFILRPTIQGVVVEPLSDSIVLRQVPTGFSLTGGPTGLALSPPTSMTDALMDAAHLTRRLNFSTIPTAALLRLANQQILAAADSPPLARGRKNRSAAENFLALGLSAEAESLLHLAAEQDPRQAASADTTELTAIAALLAGRPEEAGGLSDPRLDGTDEIALWRAVRQAMQDEGSPAAAAVFATTAPLVFQYPAAIRDRILPLIAETMIQGGEIAPAARLLAQAKDDPNLGYARALVQQADGNTGRALTMLDALAAGHDQFDRARAAVRAVELRLAARKLTKTQAADELDKLLYAWRGDSRELALRERIADLRGQTGAWRVALADLRRAETDFPDDAPAIRDRLKDTFAGMIRDQGEHQASPIDFVATVDENADLVAGSNDDEAVQQSMVDRLLALDLPDRAKPVLEKLLRTAKSAPAKARFGLSLATLAFRAGDDAEARKALDGSEGPGLPADLVEQRMILRADATAHAGDPTAASAMLAPIRTAAATEARAQILENASDWAGAEKAWSDCVALTVPDSGMLNEAQTRTILRLATATARASDDAGLADLRTKYGSRIGSSPLGDMFRLLTAEPVRTNADIARSQQEVSLAASLPADLKALQGGSANR